MFLLRDHHKKRNSRTEVRDPSVKCLGSRMTLIRYPDPHKQSAAVAHTCHPTAGDVATGRFLGFLSNLQSNERPCLRKQGDW